MKQSVYMDSLLQESTRTVVERAVALSKELNSRWDSIEKNRAEKESREPEKSNEESFVFCGKSKR